MSASALSPAWEVIISTLDRAVEWSAQFVAAGSLVESQREMIVRDWQQRREGYVRQAEAQGPVPNLPDILPLQSNEVPAVRAFRDQRLAPSSFHSHVPPSQTSHLLPRPQQRSHYPTPLRCHI